jgi:hypothetical protein
MRDYRQIPALIDALFQAGIESMRQVAFNVQKRMMAEGKPVRYPIDWDSQRQQRFVMWKLRREGNLPYRRTDRYRFGWRDQMEPFGASLRNEHPAGAIGGLPSGWQSRIHRGRWPYLLNVLFDELSKVPADIQTRLKYAVQAVKS